MKQIRKLSIALVVLAAAFSATISAGTASAKDAPSPAKSRCTITSDQQEKTNLSGRLDSCDSVLEPPKVGDKDIVAPTPQTGTMPVVKPGDLPKNKNP